MMTSWPNLRTFCHGLAYASLFSGSAATLDWHVQNLGNPYEGQHTGLAIFDLNSDGYDDVLISAGRHAIDQSFVLINLGLDPDTREFRFSEPLSLGLPGGYYQVDASPLSSLDDGHFAVLLAGGTCSVSYYCVRGTQEPAVLLDVYVTGCSVDNPDGECVIESPVIWRESPATGNRNGALSSFLTDGGDPAIVLVGYGCLTVHFPVNGLYPMDPDYMLLAEDKLEGDDDINRSAGLAVGYIGKRKGIVTGPRSSASLGPAPVVVVYMNDDRTFEHWQIEGSQPELYPGNPLFSVQTTVLDLADLNGDGNVDIAQARFISPNRVSEEFPIEQTYILVDKDPRDDVPLSSTVVWSSEREGRSVTAGQIYSDSSLPDLAYGMGNGDVLLFANLGNDSNGNFLGFELRDSLDAGLFNCQIRDIRIASLYPCTVSVVCAMTCGPGVDPGNYMFTADVDDSSCEVSPSSNPSFLLSEMPSSLPSDLPSNMPSNLPSTLPSDLPSNIPSDLPSLMPSSIPSDEPSSEPTEPN